MSAWRLAAALLVIAVLALVLPPLAARQVHARRIARAQQDVETILQALVANHGAALDAIRRNHGEGPAVLTGPGATPKFAPGAEWSTGRTLALAPTLINLSPSAAVSPDPWGNQYLVAVGAGASERVGVVSAGPNGIVETPPVGALSPAGDDLGAGR